MEWTAPIPEGLLSCSMWKYILSLTPFFAFGQSYEPDTVNVRPLNFNQDSLHADLFFEPEEGVVAGSLYLLIKDPIRWDSVWLDARPSITLPEQCSFNGEQVQTRRYKHGYVIYPTTPWETGAIELTFRSRPFKGVYFNGWNDPEGRARRQIFTQGQGIDHRHWLPHVDAQNDKLKTSLAILFNSSYEVVANGELLSVRDSEDAKRWHYAMKQPHSSYLIAFAIGEYEASGGRLLYPDWMEHFDVIYRGDELMHDSIAKRMGIPFAWSGYRQVPVQNFPHGGMENTTLTIYDDGFLTDERGFIDRNYVYVNAHEYAHHWFGDLVTAPSATDFWIHESFATYYQWYGESLVFGPEHYTVEWLKARKLVESAYERDNFPLRHGRAGTERFYQMGGMILRALEGTVGRDVFDRSVQQLLRENAFGLVTTDTVQSVFEENCQCDLSNFFHFYMEVPSWLTYQVKSEVANDQLFLEFTPNYSPGCEGTPPAENIVLRLHYTTGEVEDRLMSLSGESQWNGPLSAGLSFFEIDPNHYFPFDWKIEMTAEQWAEALQKGELRSQHLAVRALAIESWDDRKEIYDEVIADVHYSVLDSIVNQCVQAAPKDYDKVLEQYWSIRTSAQDQKVFVNRLNDVPARLKDKVVTALEEGSYATSLQAFSLLMRSHPREVMKWAEGIATAPGGVRFTNVLYKAFILWRVAGSDDERGLPVLLDVAGPSYPVNAQILAWELLKNGNYNSQELRYVQYLALTSRNRHLRNAARRHVEVYQSELSEDRFIREMAHVLQDAHPEDVERIERILGIEIN